MVDLVAVMVVRILIGQAAGPVLYVFVAAVVEVSLLRHAKGFCVSHVTV